MVASTHARFLRRPLALLVSATLALAIAPSTAARAARAGMAPPPGQQLWRARYGAPGTQDDQARALGVSPDGATVFVTGNSSKPQTVAYDAATGTRRWASPFPLGSTAYALEVSHDGSKVFATGGGFTVAYDAGTGARQWGALYNNGTANAIGVSPDDSTVFATGSSFNHNGNDDYETIAYEAATGAQRWVATYDGGVGSGDFAFALAVSPYGTRVFVTGYSYNASFTSDYATIGYDSASGGQLWVARYDGPGMGNDSAHGIGVSPDGTKVFVTGLSDEAGSYGDDDATVAYDAVTGAQLWASLWDDPFRGEDQALALSMAPDGSAIYVTGPANAEFGTIAYDPAGNELWSSLYFGPEGDSASYALGVSPDGTRVFVTGETLVPHDRYDYATVAYDAADGTQIWDAIAGGSNDDQATALGVSPDGTKVFVTGYVKHTLYNDYGTIAYQG